MHDTPPPPGGGAPEPHRRSARWRSLDRPRPAASPLDADVVVVGGGLAGLVAALTAATAGGGRRRVVLLEPRPPGGRARCDDRNGYLFNRGPRALYLGGAAAPILSRLGVDTSPGGPPDLDGAMGRRDGRLHLLPGGAWSLTRTTLLRPAEKLAVAKALRALPGLDPDAFAGRSFADVVAAFGLPPRGAELVSMLGRVATYCADHHDLDGPAALTNVQLALGAGVRYLDGGFQSIVDQLTTGARYAGVEVRAESAVAVMPATGETPPTVRTTGGELTAGAVVVASGLPDAAAGLLGRAVAGADRIGPPATVSCLELGLRRPPDHRVVFGVDEPLYLSTHCPPARVAPSGCALVQVMRYRTHDDPLDPTATREWLCAAARDAGVARDDVVEVRFLAEMVVTGGMPRPAHGLGGRPAVVDAERPGVLLAGDWVGGEGLLSDAAVASAAAAGAAAVRAPSAAGRPGWVHAGSVDR